MRQPEHDYIAVEMNAVMADKIEDLIGPNFTLALFPADLQRQGDDDPPTYFLALTAEGQAAITDRRQQT